MLKKLVKDLASLKPSTRFLETGEGVSFAVHQYGFGPQHVVLVHGFGMGASSWFPFTLPLASQYTFHAIDLPGHGRSRGSRPKAAAGFLDDYSACIESVVEDLAQDYLLCAYSIGAYASLNFLAKSSARLPLRYLHLDHPPFAGREDGWEGAMNEELMNGFAEFRQFLDDEKFVVDSVPFDRLPAQVLAKYTALLSLMTKVSLSDAWVEGIAAFAHTAPLLGRRVAQRVEWAWAYAIIEGYRNGGFDLRDKLAAIQVPTLLVGGSRHGLFAPAGMDFLVAALPNAKLVTFENRNHDLHFRSPAKFMRLLISFLKGDA